MAESIFDAQVGRMSGRAHKAAASSAPGDEEGGAGWLQDQAAEKLRAQGFSARQAAAAVSAVWSVIEGADRAAVAAAVGGEAERAKPKEDAGRFVRVMIEMLRGIVDPKEQRPRLNAWVCLAALGDEDVGSLRRIAEAYALSPQAVAMRMRALQQAHDLPENQFNKSEAACFVYQETNGRKAA
jgi:hypothetical protein